ncbi:hypothetical protein [Desulfatibacillum aliphaticivorans]|uniref:hypothetical protein n=1 Tax=Desulfatibacillum aliphaticivorans TaxID=218208 RepID=UPI0002DD8773|nr:hypothetical protein [Desulfatibacillum aliphaticivorans]
MMLVLKQAVMPDISLAVCFAQWRDIAHWLKEPPRRRKRQMEALMEEYHLLS